MANSSEKALDTHSNERGTTRGRAKTRNIVILRARGNARARGNLISRGCFNQSECATIEKSIFYGKPT